MDLFDADTVASQAFDHGPANSVSTFAVDAAFMLHCIIEHNES